MGTGARLHSSASNQVPEVRNTQELTNANHVALGAGLKPETLPLHTAAPPPHIPPEHPAEMRHMARWIWATMSQKVIVFDLAAIAEGTLALGQALSGTLNSLSREPFFSANSWLCWASPQLWRLHADSLNSFSWCVCILSFIIQTGFLISDYWQGDWLPFRHKLHSVQSVGLKHGLISFDQEPVLIHAYTYCHCFETQYFRWPVSVGKLPKSGMGQSVSTVIFLHTLAPCISNYLLSFSFLVLHNIPVYGYPIIHSPILSLGNIWAIICLGILTIKLLLAFLYGNFSYTHILLVFGSYTCGW